MIVQVVLNTVMVHHIVTVLKTHGGICGYKAMVAQCVHVLLDLITMLEHVHLLHQSNAHNAPLDTTVLELIHDFKGLHVHQGLTQTLMEL